MALEAGIAALQLLYKLAKLIQETRDNVTFIRDKLDGTESIAKLIELNLNRVDTAACPEEIIQGIRTRFTAAKHTARKMKLKYEPLLQLITSLGENATLVKAQAAVMRKGVLGVTMAVGSVSVMLWRRVERTNKKLLNSIFEALRDCGVDTEAYNRITIDKILKKLREPSVCVKENSQCNAAKLSEQLNGQLNEVEMNLDKESQELQNLMSNNLSKAHRTIDQTNDLAVDPKLNQIREPLAVKVTEMKDTIEKTSKDIENSLHDETNQGNSKSNKNVDQLQNTINFTTAHADNMIDDLPEPTRQKVQATSNQFKAAISEKSKQVRSSVSYAIGNAMGGIRSALSSGFNIAGNTISDKADLIDHHPTHLELLEAKGYHLDVFESEYTGNEWLRSLLEGIDELNRELKSVNADMKTYDTDDEEIDAGDDLVPELKNSKNGRTRKSYISEGIDLLIDYWIPPPRSNAEKDTFFSENRSTKVVAISGKATHQKFSGEDAEGSYEMFFENDLGDIRRFESENNYFEDQRVVTKHDLKKILGKGYNHANLNLVWRFLKRAEEKIEEGENFPLLGISTATSVENPMPLSFRSFDFTHGSMKRLFSKSSLPTNVDNDEAEPIIIQPATPKGKLSSWIPFCNIHPMDDTHLSEIKEYIDETEERSPLVEESKHFSHEGDHQEDAKNGDNQHPGEGSEDLHSHHLKPAALAVKPAFAVHRQSTKKFGFSDSNSSLSSFEDDEGTIPLSIFRQFIQESSKRNLGFCLSALVLCLLKLVEHPKIPGILKDAMEIVNQLLRSLLVYTGSFGILVAIEDVREIVHEDPDELLALEAEADEEALQHRMELVKSFATDFQESFDSGFAPDPSLMMSIAVEVSTSFVGLGPSTKRRLAILQSIVGLTSIEDDKKKIDTIDGSLKGEIAVIQSLPRIEKDLCSEDARNRHSAQIEHLDLLIQDQAAALKKQAERIESLQEELKSSFDIRALLGEESEIGEFWVHNFGKDCYEVHEKRFYAALIRIYDKLDEKEWKKLRSILMDTRGMITALQLLQFVGRDGSLTTVIDKFLKNNKNPGHFNDLRDPDLIENPSFRGKRGNSKKEKSKSEPETSVSFEDLRRQIASFIKKTDNSSIPTLSRNTNIPEHEPFSLPSIDNHKSDLQARRKSKEFFSNSIDNSSLPDIHSTHLKESISPAHLFHFPPAINTESLQYRYPKDKTLPSPTQSSTPLSNGSTLKKRDSSISYQSSFEDSTDNPIVLQMFLDEKYS